jgi:hypothetical protein
MLNTAMFTPVVEKIKFTKEDDLTEFQYEEDVIFDRPLVVRGTKKQFVPFPAINKMQVLSEDSLETIMNSLKQSEDFGSIYLSSISNLVPVAVEDKGFWVSVAEENTDTTNYLELFIPFDETTIAFKRLSTLLKIPYSFSKKNPGSLNEENFVLWKDRICEASRKDMPICIIYHKTNTIEVPTVNPELPVVTCNIVMTIIPVASVKKADGGSSLIKKEIADQVPILHTLIPSVVNGLKKEIPGAKIILHSIATGYDGSNRGDHYVKFLVDSPELKWVVGNDEFMPTIALRSNFTGEDKKGIGHVSISLSLMKLACANGLMVEIPEQHMQNIRDNFVNRLLQLNNVTPQHPQYSKYLLKYSKQFKRKFSNFSCNMPLNEARTNFENSDFLTLMKVFLSCKDTIIEPALAELKTPMQNIRDEDFVEVVETFSKKNKFKPEMHKAVILEYLAGKRDGIDVFPNAYALVNYMTYLSQAYNSKIQQDIESKAVSFGKDIVSALVHKAQYRQETLSRYQEMLTN